MNKLIMTLLALSATPAFANVSTCDHWRMYWPANVQFLLKATQVASDQGINVIKESFSLSSSSPDTLCTNAQDERKRCARYLPLLRTAEGRVLAVMNSSEGQVAQNLFYLDPYVEEQMDAGGTVISRECVLSPAASAIFSGGTEFKPLRRGLFYFSSAEFIPNTENVDWTIREPMPL